MQSRLQRGLRQHCAETKCLARSSDFNLTVHFREKLERRKQARMNTPQLQFPRPGDPMKRR